MAAKIKFKTSKPEDREALLVANCDFDGEEDVRKVYTEQEMHDMRKSHIDNNITIKKATEAFKIVEAAYKAEMKPLVEENAYLLGNLRAGYIDINQQVYMFANDEDGTMEIYDRFGEFVRSRKLLPHERNRQTKIK